SAPRFAPSSRNCTPLTPTLSVAAAVTNNVPLTVDPAAGAVTDTVGGVVSLDAVKDTMLSELVAAELALPAASVAAPAGTLATTVPDPVIPVTATVYVGPVPDTAATRVPPTVLPTKLTSV